MAELQQPLNHMMTQESYPAPVKEKVKREKKRKSKKSKSKESFISTEESTPLDGVTRTSVSESRHVSSSFWGKQASTANSRHPSFLSATNQLSPSEQQYNHNALRASTSSSAVNGMEMHPSYHLAPAEEKGKQAKKEKKSKKHKKRKSSTRSSCLLEASEQAAAASASGTRQDNSSGAFKSNCLDISPPREFLPMVAATDCYESSTIPQQTMTATAKRSAIKQRMSKFQQQQAQIMRELGVKQDDDFGENSARNSFGDLENSQGDISCCDSTISDLTYGTYVGGYSEKAAMMFAEQQKPASRLATAAFKGHPRRRSRIQPSSSLRSSGGLIEKAAILEEYEYDQEFEGEHDEEEGQVPYTMTAAVARAPVPSPATASTRQQPVKLEKWEMLSDEFDEAAFAQAVGSLRGSSTSNSYSNPRPNISSNANTVMAGSHQRQYPAGAVAMPGEDTGMTPEEQHSHDLLIQYLESMGADPHSAENIAKNFNQQRNGPGSPGALTGAMMLPQEKEVSQYGDQMQQQGRRAAGRRDSDASRRKMRMMMSDTGPPTRNAEVAPRPPRSFSLTWDRSEQPGAVQVETRAYGAPYRLSKKKKTQGTIASLPDEFEELPAGNFPTLEAELVGGNSTEDAFDSLEENAGVVYAESAPLNLKTAFRERSIRRPFIIATVVFVAIIVITLSVTLTRDSGGTATYVAGDVPTNSPSFQPTRIDDEISEALALVSGWEVLSKVGSPQVKALGWLSTFDEQVIETTDSHLVQRYSLAVLFYASGGSDSWLESADWLNPSLHECDWGPTTIECEEDPSRRRIVVSIDLSRNGLTGEIPPEIGELTQLTTFKVSKNKLGGLIPGKLFTIETLKVLEMRSNSFTGAIPTEVSSARDLVHLDLSFNQLSSEMPEEIFLLDNLFWFDLSFNQLTGTLSSSLGKLKRLSSFNIRHNNIFGRIPPAFDDIPKLDFILLDDNLLTGGLPEWSGALLTRQELTVSYNQLVGTIPDASSLGAIGGDLLASIRLKSVDISFNLFFGRVPVIIALVPSIRLLDLSGNTFNGTFPSRPGFWPGLVHISARENKFVGNVPSGFSDHLVHLDFASNHLDGKIPTALGAYPNLEYLSLSHNDLSSTIPREIAEMSSLEILQVRNCSLVGSIPKGLALNSAEFLDLGMNMLSGTLHSEFATVSSLEKLSLDGNGLTGRIPPDLGSLDQLRVLTLHKNSLSGTIPSRLSLLPSLENFTVADNRLVGSVPEGLCSVLPDLTFADIGCEIECSCCTGWETACVVGA